MSRARQVCGNNAILVHLTCLGSHVRSVAPVSRILVSDPLRNASCVMFAAPVTRLQIGLSPHWATGGREGGCANSKTHTACRSELSPGTSAPLDDVDLLGKKRLGRGQYSLQVGRKGVRNKDKKKG